MKMEGRVKWLYFLLLSIPNSVSASLHKPRHQQIQALGRHFSLGALYDIRRELLLGTSLWSQANVEQNKTVVPHHHQEFQIKAIDSFKQKSEFMDIEGSVEMSFIGGLLDVSGSAKYLETRKSKGKLASVSAQWKATTRVESLTQEFLSNIEYIENLDPSKLDDATHVVTRIVYGANAYLTFEKFLEDKESIKKVTGEMEGKFGGLFKIKGSIDIKEEDKSFIEDIRVIFNGDFYGITPPTTFLDAVSVVKQLADAKDEDMVPMRVTLTPLHLLDDQAVSLLREVNRDTIRKAAELKSFFEFVDTTLDDERISTYVEFFPELKRNVLILQRKFQQKEEYFSKQLQLLLPGIRNNSISEKELTDVFDQISNGVYHESFFNTWLSARNGYANTLAEILRNLEKQGVDILHDDNTFTSFLYQNKESYYVLEGSLTGADEEPYIQAMQQENRDVIDFAPIDKNAWVHSFRLQALRRINRFENVDDLRTYTKEETEQVSKKFNANLLKRGVPKSKLTGFAAFAQDGLDYGNPTVAKNKVEGIDIPKKAIRISMPGEKNALRIKTYYKGQEVNINPIENIQFVEKDKFLQFDLQEIEIAADYYPDYDPFDISGGEEENPIGGYEISLKESTRKSPDYYLNILKKEQLTAGDKYYINVRVVLKGGVRGPWNRKPYVYTKPETIVPIDGKWSPWSSEGSCSKSCGDGQQKRVRFCDRPAPVNGGRECKKESGNRGTQEQKTDKCTIKKCPVNCMVGPWTSWSSCSKSCGGGKRSRDRSVTRSASGGGAKCPNLKEVANCNTKVCDRQCEVGPWSACSKTCGGGTRTRRIIVQPIRWGCPLLSESCNNQGCFTKPCLEDLNALRNDKQDFILLDK